MDIKKRIKSIIVKIFFSAIILAIPNIFTSILSEQGVSIQSEIIEQLTSMLRLATSVLFLIINTLIVVDTIKMLFSHGSMTNPTFSHDSIFNENISKDLTSFGIDFKLLPKMFNLNFNESVDVSDLKPFKLNIDIRLDKKVKHLFNNEDISSNKNLSFSSAIQRKKFKKDYIQNIESKYNNWLYQQLNNFSKEELEIFKRIIIEAKDLELSVDDAKISYDCMLNHDTNTVSYNIQIKFKNELLCNRFNILTSNKFTKKNKLCELYYYNKYDDIFIATKEIKKIQDEIKNNINNANKDTIQILQENSKIGLRPIDINKTEKAIQ